MSLAAETPAPQQVWASLDQAERNAAYDNNAAIANSAALIEARNAASAAYREAHPGAPRHPLWRRARERRSTSTRRADPRRALPRLHPWRLLAAQFAASSSPPMPKDWRSAGWSVAMPGYTLAPQASLTTIVEEIGAALDWLADRWTGAWRRPAPSCSPAGRPARSWRRCISSIGVVAAGLAISGVYDLGPLRDTAPQRRAETQRRGDRDALPVAARRRLAEAARHRLRDARASRARS